jgi:hypothetical protein
MERKYYTPTIEEFYVGFEYETDYLNDGKWIKREFSIDMASVFFDYYYKDGSETECRVKLLDIEDIKSLGWGYEKSRFFIDINNESYFLEECYNTINKYIISILFTQDRHTLFEGNIKNKSELLKLMTQLGIK